MNATLQLQAKSLSSKSTHLTDLMDLTDLIDSIILNRKLLIYKLQKYDQNESTGAEF